MFSMSALASLYALHPKLAQARADRGFEGQGARALAIGAGRAAPGASPAAEGGPGGLATIDEALPDGGLPRGAVTEIASPRGLGRATTLALRACAAAQAEARLRSGSASTLGAWCAFVDPWGTLHAPAVVSIGVDPSRLLVVRSPVDALSRVVVRIAESRAFTVVVVDTAGVPGVVGVPGIVGGVGRLDRWGTVVRRLALAIERTDTSLLLLTDSTAHRAMPWPVALRIELERRAPGPLRLRVAKDRHGRVASPVPVAM